MKRKITLIALMLVLVTSLMVVFALSVSADDTITVKYALFDGSTRKAMTPNEDGSYTLRTEKLSNNGQVTLADGTVVDKVFYGWFTKDGTLYAPGETVFFKESTNLYEAYGIEVTTAEDLEAVKTNNYVRLGADIVTEKDLYSSWGTSTYDLNGHTLTTTHERQAIYNYRGATVLLGKGKLIHAPSNVNTNDGQTGGIVYERHGYGDSGNPQLCWIGKDVEFETPYNFIRIHHSPNLSGMPNVEIFGKVTAKNFIRAGVLTNSTVKIHESGSVTLSGTKFFDCTNESAADVYMNLSFGGTIKLTNLSAAILPDFLMTNRFNITEITNGSFTVSSADAERLAMFLPDTLMLKATENEDGTTTYNVTEADCVHSWTLNSEKSVEAVPGETGINVFDCSLCGTSKQVATIYTPKNVEISVTVRTDEGDKKYVVLAGDVFVLEESGIASTAVCLISGLKDTDEFLASQIVAFDIPAGVAEFTGFVNETVEEINIVDGASVAISLLTNMKALKTINIGASTVTFRTLSSGSVLETISSNVAGANVTFVSSCFDGRGTVKYLNLSAGSTYKFESNSFRNTGLEKVILPDDSTINFAGDAAFYGCTKLTYAYFGRNCIADKKLVRKPFDCCYSLQTVVLMDIIYIDQYVLCCNGNANSTASHREGYGLNKGALNVYSHSETLSINQNAFANRGVLGVNLYTMAEVKSLSNCVYTIYYGIGHSYVAETITESTCVTNGTAGYVTDCPCGVDYRTNAYTTYSTLDTTINEASHEPYGTDIISLPLKEEHTVSDILCNVDFVNGMTESGIKCYKCLYCDEISAKDEEATFPAIFKTMGYSFAQAKETYGIMQSFAVNFDALEQYENATGKSLNYGLAAGSVNKLGENADLVNGDGTAAEGAICASYENKSFDIFEMKISGLTDAHMDSELYCCAYYIANGKVYYMDGGVSNLEKPTTISYNKIANA